MCNSFFTFDFFLPPTHLNMVTFCVCVCLSFHLGLPICLSVCLFICVSAVRLCVCLYLCLYFSVSLSRHFSMSSSVWFSEPRTGCSHTLMTWTSPWRRRWEAEAEEAVVLPVASLPVQVWRWRWIP